MNSRTVTKLKTTKSSDIAKNFFALTREQERCHWVLVRVHVPAPSPAVTCCNRLSPDVMNSRTVTNLKTTKSNDIAKNFSRCRANRGVVTESSLETIFPHWDQPSLFSPGAPKLRFSKTSKKQISINCYWFSRGRNCWVMLEISFRNERIFVVEKVSENVWVVKNE